MEKIVSNPEIEVTTSGSGDSQKTARVIQDSTQPARFAQPQGGCKEVVDSKKRMEPPRDLPSGSYQGPMHGPHTFRGFEASGNSPSWQPLMGNEVSKSKQNPMPGLTMMVTRWPIKQNVEGTTSGVKAVIVPPTERAVEAASEAPTTSASVSKQVKEQSSAKPRSLYSIQSASADGKICKITMANSNSRFVVRTMFKTFLRPVLAKLHLQLPVNFDSFSENELRNFVNTYNSHLRNSDSAVKMGEFLTAKECEKKSIQDLMFYFAYLIKTSEGLLNIKSGRELTERYEGFMANLDMKFHVEKDFTLDFIRKYDARIGEEAIQVEIRAANEAVEAARRAQDRLAGFPGTGAGGSSANIRKPGAQLTPGRPAPVRVKQGSGAQVRAFTARLTSAQRTALFQGATSSAQAGRRPGTTPFIASLGTGIGRPTAVVALARRVLENPAARAAQLQMGVQPGTTAIRSALGRATGIGASAISSPGGPVHVPAKSANAATSRNVISAATVPTNVPGITLLNAPAGAKVPSASTTGASPVPSVFGGPKDVAPALESVVSVSSGTTDEAPAVRSEGLAFSGEIESAPVERSIGAESNGTYDEAPVERSEGSESKGTSDETSAVSSASSSGASDESSAEAPPEITFQKPTSTETVMERAQETTASTTSVTSLETIIEESETLEIEESTTGVIEVEVPTTRAQTPVEGIVEAAPAEASLEASMESVDDGAEENQKPTTSEPRQEDKPNKKTKKNTVKPAEKRPLETKKTDEDVTPTVRRSGRKPKNAPEPSNQIVEVEEIDEDAMEMEVADFDTDYDRLPEPGCDRWNDNDKSEMEWRIQNATAAGNCYSIAANQVNARIIVVEMFETVLKPVLERLHLQLPQNFEGFSQTDMATFLEEYNGKVAAWKSENPTKVLLSTSGWRKKNSRAIHAISSLAYRLAIPNPRELNNKKFSATYGETNFAQMQAILNDLQLKEDDVFLDLGSGVGNLVLFTSAYAKVRESYGVEKEEKPAARAVEYQDEFEKLMRHFGIELGTVTIIKGDFLDEEHENLIKKAKVIFVNNKVFGSKSSNKLEKILRECENGVRIVSTAKFGGSSNGNKGLEEDIQRMSTPGMLTVIKQGCSWTSKDVPFYLATIDTEKFEAEKKKKEEKAKKTSKRKAKDDGVASKRAKMDGGAGTSSEPMQ